MSVTFAVIGRNEAATLRTSLTHTLETATPLDRVVYVDGGSTDRSTEIARSMGVEVARAEPGKGRAIAAAAAVAGPDALCTIDADIAWSETNIPGRLRDAYARTGADMIVASFVQQERVRTIIPGLYRPLVRELFPEGLHVGGPTPITGFRLVGPGRMPRELPAGWGVETFLNLRLALDGFRIETIEVGRYEGPLKGYANIERMAEDIMETILELAVSEGRLDAAVRPAWEEWGEAVVDHARALPVPAAERWAFEDRLMELGARPLPAPRAVSAPR